MSLRSVHESRIEYDHYRNCHSLSGPMAALPALLGGTCPSSLLDVGCGLGTWVRAALEMGVPDVYGVDGVDIATMGMHFPPEKFIRQNLAFSWNLNRKFDVVLSLEVAEHIDRSCSEHFVENLVKHGDTIFFSAACPGQDGQHHVNCQWPIYWQGIFNDLGFACSDDVRWQIWDLDNVEPWYRQNIFMARRDLLNAGAEPRIRSVIHPEMIKFVHPSDFLARVGLGLLPTKWYIRMIFGAFGRKLSRRYLALRRMRT